MMKSFNLEQVKSGARIQFRSGCECFFVAFDEKARPHCQLVIRTKTGQLTHRYANGRLYSIGPDDPGDILMMESKKKIMKVWLVATRNGRGEVMVIPWRDGPSGRNRAGIVAIQNNLHPNQRVVGEHDFEYEDPF